MPEAAVPEPGAVKQEGCYDRALCSPFAPAPVLFLSGTEARMPLKLFLLSVSGGNAAVFCDSKPLLSAVERAAGPVSHHGTSYRPPLLVTDLPSRKAAGQPETHPADPDAGQTHNCCARVQAAVDWFWVTAHLYGGQMSIGVFAVTQGCS